MMLQQPQALPAPAPPVPPEPTAISIPGDWLPPTNRAEVEAIRAQRAELGRQLDNVAGRRAEIAGELVAADPSAKPGLQLRLDELDARIVQMEKDLATTGRLLTSPEAGRAMSQPDGDRPMGPLDSDQITAISIVFTIFVMFPIAIAISRLLWKRATGPRATRNTADSERLERVEHAVETIAIEVERISEGQRFVNKLLAQPNGVPLASAKRQGETVSVRNAGGSSEQR